MTQMIERLERKAGREGTLRARRITALHYQACRRMGVKPDASRLIIYREALECVILGLADEPCAGGYELLHDYAEHYTNPDW
jgi:hypothetical protein